MNAIKKRESRLAFILLGPAFLLLIATQLAACLDAGQGDLDPGVIEASLTPEELLPASDALLRGGRAAYERKCAACHGVLGDGEGEAAYLLFPKPRDFTAGQYRLASTWEGIPTDEDLFRTISRGMPGSAMPSWAHLSEEARWGLVHYIKSFSRNPLAVAEARAPQSRGDSGKGVIAVPPEPAFTPEARDRALALYREGCAACHGATGRGDGTRKQVDSKGFPTRPRDLTAGIYKGSPDPTEVYRRVVAGLPGSPMPQSGYLHGDDAWALAHLVLSLSSEKQRNRMEMKKFRIVAVRVPSLPDHPDAAIWRDAPPVNLHLMPLWWRAERPEEVTVKALHDDKELAILLTWPDATHNDRTIRPQDFRDAAGIQFSLDPDPPFFAMGETGSRVNIWMWKSERQADLHPAFQDLEKEYPNIGIDSYPNLQRSPLEQPMRNALTLESDPNFITAWGAGNIVADPLRKSPVEDLSAAGFGTLRARPLMDQSVRAKGVYSMGSYRVQFHRALATGRQDAAELAPGTRTEVAFAIWDGSAGDRDGKKSVTIWQELWIAR